MSQAAKSRPSVKRLDSKPAENRPVRQPSTKTAASHAAQKLQNRRLENAFAC